MAKLQKATLDPSKVSGRCGRLRCCLRYEHKTYDQLVSSLPKPGSRVRIEDGIGSVRDRQVITQLVRVQMDDTGRIITVPLEGILERNLPAQEPGQEQEEQQDRPRRGARPSRQTKPDQKDQRQAEKKPQQQSKASEDKRPQQRQPEGQGEKPTSPPTGLWPV